MLILIFINIYNVILGVNYFYTTFCLEKQNIFNFQAIGTQSLPQTAKDALRDGAKKLGKQLDTAERQAVFVPL
jgi:hypothetical protein